MTKTAEFRACGVDSMAVGENAKEIARKVIGDENGDADNWQLFLVGPLTPAESDVILAGGTARVVVSVWEGTFRAVWETASPEGSD